MHIVQPLTPCVQSSGTAVLLDLPGLERHRMVVLEDVVGAGDYAAGATRTESRCDDLFEEMGPMRFFGWHLPTSTRATFSPWVLIRPRSREHPANPAAVITAKAGQQVQAAPIQGGREVEQSTGNRKQRIGRIRGSSRLARLVASSVGVIGLVVIRASGPTSGAGYGGGSCHQSLFGSGFTPFLDTLHTVKNIEVHGPDERGRQPVRDR